MRRACLLSIFISLSIFHSASANHYYDGFIETIGIDAHISEEGVNCDAILFTAVEKFQIVLQTQFNDFNELYAGIINFIEKVKYELNPQCRYLYGGFERFIGEYIGNTHALRETTQGNLNSFYNIISSELDQAFNDLLLGETYSAGQAHGKVLRILLGIERTFSNGNGINYDNDFDQGVDYSYFGIDDNKLLRNDDGSQDLVIEVHRNHRSVGMASMELRNELTIDLEPHTMFDRRILIELQPDL